MFLVKDVYLTDLIASHNLQFFPPELRNVWGGSVILGNNSSKQELM